MRSCGGLIGSASHGRRSTKGNELSSKKKERRAVQQKEGGTFERQPDVNP